MSIYGAGALTQTPNPYGQVAVLPPGALAAVSPISSITATARVIGNRTAATDSVEISQPGQVLSQLQQLQSKDPAQFKQVLGDIAGKLQSLAQQQGQSASGAWLSNLADRFQNAATTGNLSALEQGHHHGHYHARGASGAAGEAGSQAQEALQQAFSSGGASSPPAGLQSQLSNIFAEIGTALSQ